MDVVQRDGDEEVVDVVAAEVRVAAGCDDLEDSLMQFEDGNIECAAAEVVHRDDAVFLLVEPVRQSCCRRLIHEAKDFESGDTTGVFSGLALRVVEVCGHGDDGLRDGVAEESLGILLQLLQDVGGDLGRRQCQTADAQAERLAGFGVVGQAEREELQFRFNVGQVASHQALGGVHGRGGIVHQGSAGCVADRHAIIGPRDDRRHEAFAIFTGDDDGGVALHVGDERVCGSKINTDDNAGCFRHEYLILCCSMLFRAQRCCFSGCEDAVLIVSHLEGPLFSISDGIVS